jgi:hypothetical protein
MPEHHAAADEHALMQEITAPLANLPNDPVRVAADVEFPLVLRGYDRIAVDAYVRRTSQLVAELHATHSPEAAVRRALERVGEQTAGVLQRAHETAETITAQSRAEADDRLEVARLEAAQIKASAETQLKELDADTDRIWAERRRIVDDARELARKLLELADAAAERFPAEETAPAPAAPAEETAPMPPEGVAPMPAEPPAALGEEAVTERPLRPEADGSGEPTAILKPAEATDEEAAP